MVQSSLVCSRLALVQLRLPIHSRSIVSLGFCREQGKTVRSFLAATAAGYRFAAEAPEQAGELLYQNVTDSPLSKGLVIDSAQILSQVRLRGLVTNLHCFAVHTLAMPAWFYDIMNLHDRLLLMLWLCHERAVEAISA